jgi:glycosidase
VKLNYGPNTYAKMLQILLYWAKKGVDGFRCDMAEMVPVEFWEWVIPQVKEQYPDIIFIAEVYNPQLYRDYIFRGHFDYLYDKVGLYDKLKAVTAGWCSAKELTSCWQSVEDIQGHMLNFLENHDEQRIASDFFAGDALKGRPMMLVSTLMNTNPMMIYFGQELGEKGMDSEGFSGEDGRTTIFDYWTVDTIRRWRNGGKFDSSLLTDEEKNLKEFYTQTLRLAEEEPAFSEGLFWDLMYVNGHLDRQYAFLRSDKNKTYLVVANFSDENITTDIRIPADAIRSLAPETEKVKNNLAHDVIVSVKMKAWDGIVKKIKL